MRIVEKMEASLGFLPQFKTAIDEGKKIHTIRSRRPDIKVGMLIPFHLAHRVAVFAEKEITAIQDIKITDDPFDSTGLKLLNVTIDGRKLEFPEIVELVRNEGFDSWQDFVEFFIGQEHKGLPYPSTTYEGKLIHWTDKRY